MTRKKTQEEFLSSVHKVYGDRYDYSLAEYVSAHKKVCVVCEEHGQFWITPDSHVHGHGCPVCASLVRHIHQLKSTSDFVEHARLIHGDVYDYTEVVYLGNKKKVKVICDLHGTFYPTPSNHLKGKGCPSCARYGFDPATESDLYLIQCESIAGTFTGYGITKNLEQRMNLHRKNLRNQAFTITQQLTYAFPLGSYAKELEDMLYAEYPDVSNIGSSVPGFKRESTDAPFEQVKKFIEQKIKENSQRWELLE